MALQFQRNAKLYVELTSSHGGVTSPPFIWQIPVLEGFTFSQAINTSEITVNEAGNTSRRGRLLFNDSLAPVEWSFSTYARPHLSSSLSPNTVHAVEEALWAMFIGVGMYDGSDNWDNGDQVSPQISPITHAAATSTIDFSASNVAAMSDNWNLYFAFEETGNNQVYKASRAAVNSATIDFDIDGIATIQWSGFARTLEDYSLANSPADSITANYTEAITGTSNFIRNRLTDITLVRNDVSPEDTYNVVATGGSITFENNITYLTPEELGIVNNPLANVTGARSVSGNITCYLDNNQSDSKSGELFADLVADTDDTRNVFDLDIHVGGNGNKPGVQFSLPTAHLEIPSINLEDLLTLDIGFQGQPSDGDIDNTDEATIVYHAE